MFTILYFIIISPLEYIIENFFSIFNCTFQLELGSSILFVSFAVTMMCLPFYYRADKIRKEEDEKYSEIKPYVDKIKKNFKGDEQFFMLQTLYRQHDYNPIMALRNSFSLLLQIPFFIAAYHFFSNLELLNGYSWGPILDFSKPDMLLSLNGLNINVLPILMTVVNIISCEVYLKNKSVGARLQPYTFALIFLVLLYDSPSGLVLYWTCNNFFYLLKNKFMDDNNPLKFVGGLLSFMVLSYFVCKINDIDNLKSILGQVLLLLSPFIILYFILRYRNSKFDDFKIISNNLTGTYIIKIFTICSLGFVLLQGVIIPLGLLTSDLSMFAIELNNIDNIIKFAFENLLTIIGLYFFWGAIILYFSKNKYKACFILLLLTLFLFSLVNYLGFEKNLGTIDTNLKFDTEGIVEQTFGNISSQSVNILIFLMILAFSLWLLKKAYIKQVLYLILTLLLSEMIVSGIYVTNFVNGILYIDNVNRNNLKLLQNQNNIELTKTGKNVVIIFLDRFAAGLLPMIFKEKPELKEKYSGFVFYPNTVSFYGCTVLGYPPMVGGYEYTPIVLDNDKRSFSEKWLESTLMLLTLFKNNNYISSVVDPVGDLDESVRFYKGDSFQNIYMSKGINYIKISGRHNTKFQLQEINDNKAMEIVQKKLYLYSFFCISAKFVKSFIYDKANYLLAKNNGSNALSDKIFISSYSSLLYMKDFTKINSSQNTFTLINNELPHNLRFLQYPNYEYIKEVTNKGPNLFKDEDSFKSYHTSMAAAILVGNYLDYLKQMEVYDNSRIIIVSDHGNHYLRIPSYTDFQNENVTPFNCLLMVKDFNNHLELKTDNTFMTNADVPFIATNDLIVNAKNPFTGKILSTEDKLKGADIYTTFNHWNASQFTTNRVILNKHPSIKHVQDDIFKESNWTKVDYKPNN